MNIVLFLTSENCFKRAGIGTTRLKMLCVIKNQAAQLHFIHLKFFTSHFMTFKIMHKN